MNWLKDKFPKIQDPVEDVWQSLWRGSISEFFATAIFVFIGTGAVVAAQNTSGANILEVPSLTLIAIAHGFAIMILIYSIGEVSGGHINPAVTWALLITNKISVLRSCCYIVSQLVGAIVGSAILKSVLPSQLQYGMGCHSLNPVLTEGQGLWIEVVLTFIFIFVVFATAVSPFAGKMAPLSGGDYGPGKLTPFAVGMTIMCLHTVGIPLTGASMNPARTFGPALVNDCWNHNWIYWIGPLLGSSIAATVAQLIFLSHLRAIEKVFQITRGITKRQHQEQNKHENEISLTENNEEKL
jgi:MIP family channel proteins